MIYIDFFGGSHGHFLEFLISRYVLQIHEYQNHLPFTPSGTSHIKPTIDNGQKNICTAEHYSFYTEKQNNLSNKIKSDDLLIRINISTEDIYYLVYNTSSRAGDVKMDLDHLEIDTIRKIKEGKEKLQNWLLYLPDTPNTPRSILRNMFYSQMREEFHWQQVNNFYDFKCNNIITVNIHTFYNYDLLVNFLNLIADRLGAQPHFDDFLEVWQQFISKLECLPSKLKVDNFFEFVLNDVDTDIKFNILEEAYLNVLITKLFDIHGDMSIFEDSYPCSSLTISREIKQIMKNRNKSFSLQLPILKQLEMIRKL
jgi:hypothetical protein